MEAKDYKKLRDTYLKDNGYDPHSFKSEYVGTNGGRYDIYEDKSNHELLLIDKSGKGELRTGEIFVRCNDMSIEYSNA